MLRTLISFFKVPVLAAPKVRSYRAAMNSQIPHPMVKRRRRALVGKTALNYAIVLSEQTLSKTKFARTS